MNDDKVEGERAYLVDKGKSVFGARRESVEEMRAWTAKKRPGFVRLLLVLGILVSLTVITAVPASAAAGIIISPNSGPVCTSVTIKASGFHPFTSLIVQFDGFPVTTTPSVVITDASGNVEYALRIPDLAAGGWHTIRVSDGANSVSSTFNVTGRLLIQSQLSSIAGKYTVVWGYDAAEQLWSAYSPAEPPCTNDLTRLEVGKAYWINATENSTLMYSGGRHFLQKGWNLIGWPGPGYEAPTGGPTPTPSPGGGAAGGAGRKGGCFIATAAYGSYLDASVETLRTFRDSYLMANPVGQGLTSTYYRLSPPAAGFIDDHPALKPIVRLGLLPAVAISTMAVSTTLAEKVAIAGSLALISITLAAWARRRRNKGSQYC